MTIRKIEQIKEIVDHPLEEFFNIEPSSTEIVKHVRKTELTPYEDFDNKDTEIEETYQEIYDAAMTGYDELRDLIDTADTKFAARLAEVSVQHLNVALAAASKRAHLKENKDKLLTRVRTASAGKGGTTNNIVVVANRNDVLKQLQENPDIIDAEFTSGDSENTGNDNDSER